MQIAIYEVANVTILLMNISQSFVIRNSHKQVK